MGVDYQAEAIIGVRVDARQMKLCWTENKVIRGCVHDVPEESKFCSECGQPREVDFTEQDEDLMEQITYHRKFHGLSVAYDGTVHDCPDTAVFVVGKYLVTTDSNRSGSSNMAFKQLLTPIIKLAHIKQEIKAVLEPLGLWDETMFGIYSVLNCSY